MNWRQKNREGIKIDKMPGSFQLYIDRHGKEIIQDSISIDLSVILGLKA